MGTASQPLYDSFPTIGNPNFQVNQYASRGLIYSFLHQANAMQVKKPNGYIADAFEALEGPSFASVKSVGRSGSCRMEDLMLSAIAIAAKSPAVSPMEKTILPKGREFAPKARLKGIGGVLLCALLLNFCYASQPP